MAEHRVTSGALLLLLALVSTARAQAPLLVTGARVRVTGPCLVELPSGPGQCTVVVGRLRRWTPDSVIVQVGSGAELAIARSATRLVEVSDGIRSQQGLGTLVGAAVGLGVGLALPCESSDPNDPDVDHEVCTFLRWMVVPLTVGIGAGLGRIVGMVIRSESWVSLGGDVATVGIAPRGTTGLALTMRVRF